MWCFRWSIIACAPLLLQACATPSTGVVPIGDGISSVTHQGAGAWVSTNSLKAAALQEAGVSCHLAGKGLRVVHTKEIPAGAFGRWPEAEVLFRCE